MKVKVTNLSVAFFMAYSERSEFCSRLEQLPSKKGFEWVKRARPVYMWKSVKLSEKYKHYYRVKCSGFTIKLFFDPWSADLDSQREFLRIQVELASMNKEELQRVNLVISFLLGVKSGRSVSDYWRIRRVGMSVIVNELDASGTYCMTGIRASTYRKRGLTTPRLKACFPICLTPPDMSASQQELGLEDPVEVIADATNIRLNLRACRSAKTGAGDFNHESLLAMPNPLASLRVYKLPADHTLVGSDLVDHHFYRRCRTKGMNYAMSQIHGKRARHEVRVALRPYRVDDFSSDLDLSAEQSKALKSVVKPFMRRC